MMQTIHITEDTEDAEEYLDLVLELFTSQAIRLHSNYSDFLVVLDGGVVAAAALSMNDRDDPPSIEFSIAVAPSQHRKGYARALVKDVIRHARGLKGDFGWDEVVIEGYVVNKTAIPPLLREFGFQQGRAPEPNRWRLRI